ncbi:MAG TPA: sulfotransferase family 2 domain-containing protein [Pseudolabrys sp.]|jgi:hypothetical protein|nr:sulfotransferase family 2 domain-containing protein [Pseudolabrys sp.]
MIVHGAKAIFVHIQKSGGDSISAALGQPSNCPEKHFLARELKERYGDSAWDSYFKFSFVRNPWDRLVSWWSMIDRHRAAFEAGRRFNNFQTFVLTQARTFEEFLDRCDQEIADPDGRKWIYRNQLDYLTDTSGRLMVDFVGRFEKISEDFNSVAQKLGLSTELPHVNKSSHDHYVRYYTPALADEVGRRFERDIATFGYAFGE